MKKIGFVFLSLVIGIFALSCVTVDNKGKYPKNSTVSEDQLCTLIIKERVEVAVFDGKFVRWNHAAASFQTTKVLIEPGVHQLFIETIDQESKITGSKTTTYADQRITETEYTITIKATKDGFEIDFIPGHHYEISKSNNNVASTVAGAVFLGTYNISGLQIRNLTTKEWLFKRK